MRSSLGAALLAAMLAGCPQDPAPGDCAGAGEPRVIVSRRDDDAPPLADGADLDVFPPPQGGTFTELDIVLKGLTSEEVEELRIDIQRQDDGSPLSAQRYQGGALVAVYQCLPDDTLLLHNVPVAFVESVVLDDLEGVAVRMSVVVTTADAEVRFDVDLVLTVTSF